MFVMPAVKDGYSYPPYFNNSSVNSNLYFESPGTLENNYVPVSKRNALTQLYCMENGNSVPSNQNATQVVIKGVYTPDVLYQADRETLYTGFRTGDDFWRVVTIENGQRVYQDEYYGEDPSDYMKEDERLVYYSKGETYYFLYLDREDYLYPHNYTVKRNSFYNIDITRVNNAGDEKEDPDIDLPGPGPGPEPSTEPQISVTITISEWDLIQGNGEL